MLFLSDPLSYADQRQTGLQKHVGHGHESCCVNINTAATAAAQLLNVFSPLGLSTLDLAF